MSVKCCSLLTSLSLSLSLSPAVPSDRLTGCKHTEDEVYILLVHWNDGTPRHIFRSYTAFFDFRASLKEQLHNRKEIRIPELPALKWFERGILNSMKAGVMEKKRTHIEDFCQNVLRMPKDIVRGPTVQSFFKPWMNDEDPNLHSSFYTPSPRSKRTAAAAAATDRDRPQNGSVKLKNTADESPEQLYTATSTYDKRRSGEVSLKQGDLVDVIQKDLSGWWFVHVEGTGQEGTGQEGWAPGAYLESNSADLASEAEVHQPGSLGKFRTLVAYRGSCEDELSYGKGEEVEVLSVNMDGWWTIKYKGESGITPATNLEQITNSEDDVVRRDKSNNIARTLYQHHSIYKKRSPPPRKVENDPSHLYARVDKQRAKLKVPGSPHDSSLGSDLSLDNNIPLAGTRNSSPPSAAKKIVRNPTLNYTEIEFDSGSDRKMVLRQESGVIYTEVLPIGQEDGNNSGQERVATYENVTLFDDAIKLNSAEKPRYYIAVQPHTPSSRGGLPLAAGDVILVESESGCRVEAILCSTDQSRTHSLRRGWVPREILEDFLPEVIDWPSGHQAPVVAPHKSQMEKAKSVDADDLDLHVSIPPPASASPTHSPVISPLRSCQPPPPPVESGVIVLEAICNYESKEPSTASFDVGDTAIKVKDSPSGWMCVRLHNKVTWVPGKYWREKMVNSSQSDQVKPVTKDSDKRKKSRSSDYRAGPWFMGVMNRVDCENLLLDRAEDKGFVIRASTNRVGDYTLSVRYGDRVRHFPIVHTEAGQYCIGKYNFKDLTKVVHYYQGNPLFNHYQ
ncbi:hypothetical protein CAPTEDRAFT_226195 [Capitella teleta]|uniref:Uncharacterized protein n=1 Tax=Capitella teleta TaxID=283909 RepID=R7U5N4_CAPTE|nr:hypothetical protein CAPTEDRAFT_226195 [Capitella teleta]|eukprot:ELT99001.1 hypothetical protein CAPTEDRAFT_226195 [Capitella teleta]